MSDDDWEGLWRGSATEAVPYAEDYTEALIVLPELWDGAIGQGQASTVTTTMKWLTEEKALLTVKDDGLGIKNERRLLRWAAPKSTDNLHRNGHGTKKALTKFHRDYPTAVWTIKYRRKGKNLQIISGPFLGNDTKVEEVEESDDHETLMPSGTQIEIEFNPTVLGKYAADCDGLHNALRELVTTRMSEAVLQKTDFIIDIQKFKYSKSISGKAAGWHSFEWHMENAIASKTTKVVSKHVEQIVGGRWEYTQYHILPSGKSSYHLKDPRMFPLYGQKNMLGSRVHISLDDRMIEAIHMYKIMKSPANHNNYNGQVGFVRFFADSPQAAVDHMPIPCTTKVSFYENGDVFKKFKEVLYNFIEKHPFVGEEKSDDDESAAAAVAKKEKAKVKAQESKSVLEALKGKAVAAVPAAAGVPAVAAVPAAETTITTITNAAAITQVKQVKKPIPIIRSVSAFRPIITQTSSTHTLVHNGTPTYVLTSNAAAAAASASYTFKFNTQEDLVDVYDNTNCISKIPIPLMKRLIDAHKV